MKEVLPAEVYDLMRNESKALFIDVRSSATFLSGTADLQAVQNAAFNVPIKDSNSIINQKFLDLLQDNVGQIDDDACLIFMCYHGNSSKIACQMVEDEKSCKVYNLTGGFHGWQSAKMPVTRGEELDQR